MNDENKRKNLPLIIGGIAALVIAVTGMVLVFLFGTIIEKTNEKIDRSKPFKEMSDTDYGWSRYMDGYPLLYDEERGCNVRYNSLNDKYFYILDPAKMDPNAAERAKAEIISQLTDVTESIPDECWIEQTVVHHVVYDVMMDVIYNEPELIWFHARLNDEEDPIYRTSYPQEDTTLIQMELEPAYTEAEYLEMYKALLAERDRVIAQIESELPENPTDYDRLLAIHNYIVNNVEYDSETWENKGDPAICEEMAWTAYGALILHKAVCAGYANAFTMLAREMGITSGYVGGGSHAWNYVLLDGQYYWVDTTWDCVHKTDIFFLCDNKTLLKKHKKIPAHVLDGNYGMFTPVCDSGCYTP